MTHKQKKKLARRMAGTNKRIFLTKSWKVRRQQIANKVKSKVMKAKKWKVKKLLGKKKKQQQEAK